MKFSNIFGAYRSTIIGLAITILTSVYTALQAPPINWKAIGSAAILAVILAVTDILKEKQK